MRTLIQEQTSKIIPSEAGEARQQCVHRHVRPCGVQFRKLSRVHVRKLFYVNLETHWQLHSKSTVATGIRRSVYPDFPLNRTRKTYTDYSF